MQQLSTFILEAARKIYVKSTMESYCIISNFIYILIFILKCNMTANPGMKNEIILPLVKVVDCTEQDAIYQYDYKVG